MSKMKRVAAIVLAAAMTMGSTLTVFADGTGSGTTSGKGENEGHVDKEVINVVLPTVPEGDGSPFEYITDPERLIQSTAGARYEDYKFPDAGDDTGVYFRVGEKEFANTSETLQVINKSSCDVTVTVTAKATAVGDKDLALATSSTTSAATPLYLNLKIGATDQAISTSEASVAKTIAGNAANFEVQYTGSAYEYVPKVDAYQWKALNLSLNGAVDEAAVVTGETTAPTVDVTWSYAKADGASPDTGDQTDYEESGEAEIISISSLVKADPKDIVIKFSLGKGPNVVDANGAVLSHGPSKGTVGTAVYTVNMDARTVTIKKDAGFLANASGDYPLHITLTKDGKNVKTLTGTLKVKADYDSAGIISVTEYDKTNPQNIVISFTLGEGSKAVDADGATLSHGAGKGTVGTTAYTVDMNAKTVTIKKDAGFLANVTADYPIYVTLTKGGSPVTELSGTIKAK